MQQDGRIIQFPLQGLLEEMSSLLLLPQVEEEHPRRIQCARVPLDGQGSVEVVNNS